MIQDFHQKEILDGEPLLDEQWRMGAEYLAGSVPMAARRRGACPVTH